MKQKTGKFRQVEDLIDVCDWCKKELTDDNHIDWDAVDYIHDEEYGYRFEVCSFECLSAYLRNHLSQLPSIESIKLFVPIKFVGDFMNLILDNIK